MHKSEVALAVCAMAILVQPGTVTQERHPQPVFTGIVVKLADSRQESQQAIRPTEDAARLIGEGQAWSVSDVPATIGTFRLTPSRTETSQALENADVWQRVHTLRKHPAFEYVEPSFLVPGAIGESTEIEDCVAASAIESGSDTKPIPGAEKDSEWSLGPRGANVLAAWQAFGTSTPGHDVWIGHPDTGYREHPEIWLTDGPLQPALGWDFVDNDNDPTDAFRDGFLRWPGHGTRTSSAIISPRGRQLAGTQARGISGVAPGAKLIPLRVANGVVLFDQVNLASAIRAAAGDDRTLVKQKVDVISISLGGPHSRVLEDAVKFAEQQGVLVIAAAGNEVKKVVWPARYPHVIAVAASNFDSKVWTGSSGGSMVAIGAPGESVWIASPKMQANISLNCLSMSSGTSYGTATTAGIAALWVSLHREKPSFKALRSVGQQTTEFRRILHATKRTGTDWNTAKYGPGIIDAAAVLAAPLSRPVEASPTKPSRCDANLAALTSLFDEGGSPPVRIASLFHTRVARLCSIASLTDEIAFLYATDRSVAEALDRVTGPASPSPEDYSAARRAVRSAASTPLRNAIPDR